MSDWRLVLTSIEPPKLFGFRRAKSRKCWFLRIDGLEKAKSLSLQLSALNIHGVIKKADAPKPRKRFARRKGKKGPVFQVIDGNADPRAALIAAYRKLEWLDAKREFTATAPQYAPESDLPEPKTALHKKRQPTSLAEEVPLRGSAINGARRL